MGVASHLLTQLQSHTVSLALHSIVYKQVAPASPKWRGTVHLLVEEWQSLTGVGDAADAIFGNDTLHNGPLSSASRVTNSESEVGASEPGYCELWTNLRQTLLSGLRAS